MTSRRSAASIIVPTYREAANIEPLVGRVFAAFAAAGREGELVIVDDDSQDGMETIVAKLAVRHPVRLIVRRGERGLASAVLAGLGAARFDQFVVLDADLQHPPEMIPALLDRLEEGGCDFVIATRYAEGSGIAGDWPFLRRAGSWLATLLARPLMPVSDPMSGFFALDRKTWERAEKLSPIGYKIGLELFVKARCRRPAEVPITFEARAVGASKFGFREQLRYLRHLRRLYWSRYPRITRVLLGAMMIGMVGLFGWTLLD